MAEKVADGVGDLSLTKDSIHADGGCEPSMRRNDAESLRKMQLSIAASSSVFPGFRFSPTDDELISYYLTKKLEGSDRCVDIIRELDLCRHEPWDLPGLSVIQSDNEWFFFSTRGKKYPNGSQSKRATECGYWKATGKERNVKSGGDVIGTKRTLVFHMGRAPKGERTEWIMHEYCMCDATQESLVVCRVRRNGDFRLNESSRGSSRRRNLSATDNSHSDTNEHDNTQMDGQMDGFYEVKPIMPAPKESTSGHRSHSLEQNDSGGSEYDQQANPGSTHGSSSPNKDCDDEDDCFADIINDDIVDLDESASHSLTLQGVVPKALPIVLHDPSKCMQKLPQETMSSRVFEGTAARRIKLRRKQGPIHEQPVADGGQDQPNPLQKKSSGCFFSVLTGNANTLAGSRTTHVILVLLFLLIVFVAWKGNQLTSYSKQHLGSGWEVWKRQLKHWLRKAAD